ncbi:hypothetical protein [Tellurirhabdus bombi]|uniref:hypothetical protein n=1 Tax=Tellurirhabdus bombi TaxID=2907205 RepID=UPI001F3F6F1F|nr:hypothetical protein [Tellurirhabdus bombi]
MKTSEIFAALEEGKKIILEGQNVPIEPKIYYGKLQGVTPSGPGTIFYSEIGIITSIVKNPERWNIVQ